MRFNRFKNFRDRLLAFELRGQNGKLGPILGAFDFGAAFKPAAATNITLIP